MAALRAIGVIIVFELIGCGDPGVPGAEPPSSRPGGHRLANSTSPYLRMHADNPVEWYPWGPEAFERAKREQKPIFLSIGYSSCHWCHVMEKESFENEEIARILNEHFISIKVDREERPDVDEVYITAVQLMQQSAGWPLSVFLTPDGLPFYGGTYFPPEDRDGMIGFKTVLLRIAEAWRTHRMELTRTGQQVMEAVRQHLQPRTGPVLQALDERFVDQAVADLRRRFDPAYGGFGYSEFHERVPKFPEAPRLLLLADLSERDDAAAMLKKTLDAMAAGGIYDHLGGGFHRYSTDRRWEVPHFEKMLYDNGLLLSVYARAYQEGRSAEYAEVLHGTVRFLEREMRHPQGAFFAALDADSEGKEGWYYLWSEAELRGLLRPPEWEVFRRLFDPARAPRLEGRIVLVRRKSPAEVAEEMGRREGEVVELWHKVRQRLLEARERRSRPFRDEKIIAAWNGYAIAGLADAAEALQCDHCAALAESAAQAVLDLLVDPPELYRSSLDGQRGPRATLEDYAALVWAFLRLADATRSEAWLRQAQRWADQMLVRFWDDRTKSFWFVTEDHDLHLPVRPQLSPDGATPGAVPLAIRALVRLANRTGERSYAHVAGMAMASVAVPVSRIPSAYPTLLLALAEYRAVGYPEEWLKGQTGKTDYPVTIQVREPERPASLGAEVELLVELRVEDGWHVYAPDPGNPYAVALSVELSSHPPVEVVAVRYPTGTEQAGFGGMRAKVLTGEVPIRVLVRVPETLADGIDAIRGRLTVRYQACSTDRCLAPQGQAVSFYLPVARQ